MSDTLTREMFAPCIGSTFHVRTTAEAALPVELIEVEDLRRPGVGLPDVRAPFSLVFRGPRTPVLPQRTFRLEHPDLGSQDIFLVPIGPDKQGMRYQAVFN